MSLNNTIRNFIQILPNTYSCKNITESEVLRLYKIFKKKKKKKKKMLLQPKMELLPLPISNVVKLERQK